MNVVMVAPFPRGRDAHAEHGLGGVAAYARQLVDAMRAHADVRVLSLWPGAAGEARREEPGVVDVDPPEVFRALARLRRDPSVDVVHVQFEQHLFGGPAGTLRLVRALRGLRRVVVTIHQVPALGDVDRTFLAANGFPPFPRLARAWMRVQYRALARVADVFVVHEQAFADRLVHGYGVDASRVRVVPHGVDAQAPDLTPAEAKAKLGVGDATLLVYFGYVTGYKGVDLLVDALERLPPERRGGLRVVVAGKAPDRKLEKAGFRAAVDDLEQRIAALAPWVERRGFLTEAEIEVHLAAADAVVLPYRHVFGASGPLSLAVGRGRPVLASDAFRGTCVGESSLFARDPDALLAKIEAFVADPRLRATLADDAARMRDAATWPEVARRTIGCYGGVAP